MTVVLHPPYFSVFPTDDKTERPPFETTELIETESQAMLRIRLKWQKRSGCIRVEEGYFESDGGQFVHSF
jgi:hypothetical protein